MACCGFFLFILGVICIIVSTLLAGFVIPAANILITDLLTPISPNIANRASKLSTAEVSKWSNRTNVSSTKYYLQHISNLNDVQTKGAVPIIEDYGPYTFNQKTKKMNAAFTKTDDEETIKYREFSIYKYDAAASCKEADSTAKCTDLSDNLNVVNPAYISLMGTVKNLLGGNDALLAGLINGMLYNNLHQLNLASSLESLVSAVFFPMLMPSWFLSNGATALSVFPYLQMSGYIGALAGNSMTLQQGVDAYNWVPEVTTQYGVPVSHTGHASLTSGVKTVLYTAQSPLAIHNDTGLALWTQFAIGYNGAFKQTFLTVYGQQLAGGASASAAGAAAKAYMEASTTQAALVALTPNVTLLGTTYVLQSQMDAVNLAGSGGAGTSFTNNLNSANIGGVLGFVYDQATTAFPSMWNAQTNFSVAPYNAAVPASFNKAWLKNANPLLTSNLGGTGANWTYIARELWGLENPTSPPNKCAFLHNATANVGKLGQLILGVQVAAASGGESGAVAYI